MGLRLPGGATSLPVAASFGVYMIPVAAVVCIGLLLSALTRNSAAAVVGTLMFALLMQLVGILPGLSGADPYLLTTQFQAWQGFFRTPTDWAGNWSKPDRFPRRVIQSPAVLPKHCTMAPPFQQPTTVSPSRSCSFARARSGAPDVLRTVSV